MSTDDLARVSNDLLTYMLLSGVGSTRFNKIRVGMSYFDGAVPCMFEWLEGQLAHLREWMDRDYPRDPPVLFREGNENGDNDREDFDRFLNSFSPNPSDPIDVRILNPAIKEGTDERCTRAAFGATRLRRVTTKQVQGRVKEVWPQTFEYTTAFVRRADGACDIAARTYLAWTPSGWRVTGSNIHRGNNNHACFAQDCLRITRVAMLINFLSGITWRVQIAMEKGPSVTFMTDPFGVREVFRLRDIPNGKARRAALLHWVTDHWRENRKADPVELHYVRQHLRGQRKFSWNGLQCQIFPSRADQQWLESAPHSQVILPQMPAIELPAPTQTVSMADLEETMGIVWTGLAVA